MKASLKFRDEQKPLFRAKVPVSLLGFPFQSGIAAGESKELSLSLATLFDSGPSLRVGYRPNDSLNPFSLELRTGIGSYGTPNSASMTMSAEFNPLQPCNPKFFIRFKPRLGDFSIKKTHSSGLNPKAAAGLDDGSVEFFESPPSPANGGYATLFRGKPPVGGANLMGSFISGMEVSARTVLPMRGGAVVKCRWGVRFPAELRDALTVDAVKNRAAGISIRQLPTLVMDKIAIEHGKVDGGSEERAEAVPAISITGSVDQVESYFGAKCRMDDLQSENRLLKKAVEDLRSEISEISGSLSSSPVGSFDTGRLGGGPRSELGSSAGVVHRGKQGSGEKRPVEFDPAAGKFVASDVSKESKKA